MAYTERFTEVNYPLIHEPADSFTPATATSSYVSLAKYHRAVLLFSVGDMQSSATLDVKLRQAKDSSGTGVKDITGKAITQLTQAGSDSNKLVAIELRTEELDVTNGFEHVCVVAVVGAGNVEYAYILLGCQPRYAAVATTNFEEIVD